MLQWPTQRVHLSLTEESQGSVAIHKQMPANLYELWQLKIYMDICLMSGPKCISSERLIITLFNLLTVRLLNHGVYLIFLALLLSCVFIC